MQLPNFGSCFLCWNIREEKVTKIEKVEVWFTFWTVELTLQLRCFTRWVLPQLWCLQRVLLVSSFGVFSSSEDKFSMGKFWLHLHWCWPMTNTKGAAGTNLLWPSGRQLGKKPLSRRSKQRPEGSPVRPGQDRPLALAWSPRQAILCCCWPSQSERPGVPISDIYLC